MKFSRQGSSKPANFHVPAEIVAIILSYLIPPQPLSISPASRKALVSATHISKGWHASSNEYLYRHVSLSSWISARLFLRTVKRSPELAALVHSIAFPYNAPTEVPAGFTVQVGRWLGISKHMGRPQVVHNVLILCPGAKAVDIPASYFNVESLRPDILARMERLAISATNGCMDMDFFHLNNLHNLKSLTFYTTADYFCWTCWPFPWNKKIRGIHRYPGLTRLRIESTGMADYGMTEFLKSFIGYNPSNLTCLELYNIWFSQNYMSGILGQVSGTLQELLLQRVRGFDLTTVRNVKQLRRVVVDLAVLRNVRDWLPPSISEIVVADIRGKDPTLWTIASEVFALLRCSMQTLPNLQKVHIQALHAWRQLWECRIVAYCLKAACDSRGLQLEIDIMPRERQALKMNVCANRPAVTGRRRLRLQKPGGM